jgi:hypothetical protein
MLIAICSRRPLGSPDVKDFLRLGLGRKCTSLMRHSIPVIAKEHGSYSSFGSGIAATYPSR